MKNIFLIILLSILFSCNNKSDKSEILGKWIIESSELESFGLPNDCSALESDDIFIFEENNFKIKRASNIICKNYSYRIQDSLLKVQVSDIAFNLKILRHDEDKLILSSKFLPKQMMINWKEEYADYKKNGFKIELSRK